MPCGCDREAGFAVNTSRKGAISMATDYLPKREADLVNWSAGFSAYITANAAAVGLQSSQATSYAALHASWVSAFDTATNNSTRTPAAIEAKNDAKKLLVASARQLVGI